MISRTQALHHLIRSKFDLGVKNLELSGNELTISAREEKLFAVMDYMAENLDARLVDVIVNDFVSRVELLDVFFVNHMGTRVIIRRGIDTRNKKIASISDHYVPANYLERFNGRFCNVDFAPRDGDKVTPPASVSDIDVPWVPAEADDGVDKTSFLDGPGIYSSCLDIGDYVWVKIRQGALTAVKCQPGHAHKGIIRFAEHSSLDRLPFILSRACWHDKYHALLASALALERAADVTRRVPLIAKYWRSFACELERLRNHHAFITSWFELTGNHDLREINKNIMRDLQHVEKLFVSKVDGTPFITMGGIAFDPLGNDAAGIKPIKSTLVTYENDLIGSLINPVVNEGIFDQFKSFGIIRRDKANLTGISGPSLRASGFPFDTRHNFPYDAYATGLIRWDTCLASDGDVRSRVEVHALEMVQSLRIMYQLLSLIDEEPRPGPDDFRVVTPRMKPNGEGFATVESAGGEMHAYVRASNDGGSLHTFRLLPPSFLNFHSLEHVIGPTRARKFSLILHSFDICWKCVDL